MRLVTDPEQLSRAMDAASREAQAAFGDGRVFLERYIPSPRHIEFQVLAHILTHFFRDSGCRGFFDDFLMSALHGAIALS